MNHALTYAPFWRRLVARAIDIAVIVVANFIFFVGYKFGADAGWWPRTMLGDGPAPGEAFSALNVLFGLFVIGFPPFYFVYLHGAYGQTFGKMLLGTRVLHEDGFRLTWTRSLLRYGAEFVYIAVVSPILSAITVIVILFVGVAMDFVLGNAASLVSGLNWLRNAVDWVVGLAFLAAYFLFGATMFLWAAFDRHRQGLHDKACKTIVVMSVPDAVTVGETRRSAEGTGAPSTSTEPAENAPAAPLTGVDNGG